MLCQLKDLLTKEGKLSSRVIDLSPAVLSSCSYVRRLGSLQAAYEQLGYTPIKEDRRHLSPHLREKGPILKNLKLLLDEKGFLSTAEIVACPRLPAVKIITRQFGSLDEAYRAAGYNRTPGERVLDGRERGRLDRERLRTK